MATLYDETMPERAEELCRVHGMTMTQLGVAFGVDRVTLYRWQTRHPEFAAALRRGKDAFDLSRVEPSLLKRALGYEVVERTRKERLVEVWDPMTGETTKEPQMVVTKEVTKHIAADVIACIFWLKNRDRDRWRDKTELAVTGVEALAEAMTEARKRVTASRAES